MLVKAKSKLYLAGEYAVLKENSYAIIASVDKYTYLDIEESEEEIVISDIVDKDNILKNARDVAFDYIGYKKNFKYVYSTDLYQNGTKYGLGSSASVAVVTIKAILKYFNTEYTKDKLFELSVKALKKSNIQGSMGDVACICYEDLILYKSIDANMNYEIKKINLKKDLIINAYWTKKEASTAKQIENIKDILNTNNFEKFVETSNKYTLDMLYSLENADSKKLNESIVCLRNNLKYLEKISNVVIHSEVVNEIIKKDNFKTSGAGKGDFVISLEIGEKNEKESTHRVFFNV